MGLPSGAVIFLSYRRGDTAGHAGRLFDRLASRFGREAVFMDVDTIRPGEDFARAISERVGTCDVLIALIGDQWLTATDAGGRRRIEDPADFVRAEIEAALQRGIPIVPILVEGARMPAASELPDSMRGLVLRQAMEVSDTRFDAEAEDLVRAVATHLPEQRRAADEVARGRRRVLAAVSVVLVVTVAGFWYARRREKIPELAGRWVAEVENPGREPFQVVLDFRVMQEGEKEVLGSVVFPAGSGVIRGGRLEGRRLSFETVHQAQFEDKPATSQFKAEFKGQELHGVLQTEYQVRAFVARRRTP